MRDRAWRRRQTENIRRRRHKDSDLDSYHDVYSKEELSKRSGRLRKSKVRRFWCTCERCRPKLHYSGVKAYRKCEQSKVHGMEYEERDFFGELGTTIKPMREWSGDKRTYEKKKRVRLGVTKEELKRRWNERNAERRAWIDAFYARMRALKAKEAETNESQTLILH